MRPRENEGYRIINEGNTGGAILQQDLCWGGSTAIPPVILGRLKKPVVAKIADKVLYTDASMYAADWQTGLAGILGIPGVGSGFWREDAVAAGFISLSILTDGLSSVRTSVIEPAEPGGCTRVTAKVS